MRKAPDRTATTAAGCVAMPGYRFHQGKTVDCNKYPGTSCALGTAGPMLAAMIEACNSDPHCLAVATDGRLKVRGGCEGIGGQKPATVQHCAAAGAATATGPAACLPAWTPPAGLPACRDVMGCLPKCGHLRRAVFQDPPGWGPVLLRLATCIHKLHWRRPAVPRPAWRPVPLRWPALGGRLLRKVPCHDGLRRLHAALGRCSAHHRHMCTEAGHRLHRNQRCRPRLSGHGSLGRCCAALAAHAALLALHGLQAPPAAAHSP